MDPAIDSTLEERVEPGEPETVTCRICKEPVSKKPNAFSGHLRHHKRTKNIAWNKATYVKKFGIAAALDFVAYQNKPEVIEANRLRLLKTRDEEGKMQAPQLAVDTLTGNFTLGERAEFDENFDIIFQKVDRDPIQRPRVHQYCVYMVQLNRLLEAQMSKAVKVNEDAEKSIKLVEERIQKLATSLGISREQQIKNRVNVRSSPAALISGYEIEIERMDTEMLATMLSDEQRQSSITKERLERYILPNAIVEEKTEEEDVTIPPDLEQIIRRSGVNL